MKRADSNRISEKLYRQHSVHNMDSLVNKICRENAFTLAGCPPWIMHTKNACRPLYPSYICGWCLCCILSMRGFPLPYSASHAGCSVQQPPFSVSYISSFTFSLSWRLESPVSSLILEISSSTIWLIVSILYTPFFWGWTPRFLTST